VRLPSLCPLNLIDEPTTGLDPRSRSDVWDAIRELAISGTTVLLTTQYLEEADRLCARISLVDDGRVVVDGSPAELKSRVGGSRVEMIVPEGHDVTSTAEHASAIIGEVPSIDPTTRRVSLSMRGGAETLARLADGLAVIGLQLEDLSLRRPDLDEVFLRLTAPATQEGTTS